MIEISHLHYRIGQSPILKDISLTLPEKGMTALIGPNGAGKSTLLSFISRLEPIQEGDIRIDGRSLATIDSREMAKTLAILTQYQDIQTRLTVHELLGFGRYPYHQGKPTEADEIVIDEMLERMELTALKGRYLNTLSGGQRQRALIAMTLCQSTKYLLLDEPLNNLDMYYARELMRTLKVYVEEKKIGVTMVVHDINMAAAWADHIVALKNGSVIREGSPGEVVTVNNMKDIFNMDVDVLDHRGKPLVVNCL